MKRLLALATLMLLLGGCAATPTAEATPVSSPIPPAPSYASSHPMPPADIVVTMYGSDIQVVGATYDDSAAVQDLGRVADGYQIVVPPGTGFSWGAVSWNGQKDAGCRVTQGDVVLIDNTAPNQLSAQCQDFDGF